MLSVKAIFYGGISQDKKCVVVIEIRGNYSFPMFPCPNAKINSTKTLISRNIFALEEK